MIVADCRWKSPGESLVARLPSSQARRRFVPTFDFSILHAGLGDLDATFAWLDRALADRSTRPYLMDPTFDTIRSSRLAGGTRGGHSPARRRAAMWDRPAAA